MDYELRIVVEKVAVRDHGVNSLKINKLIS